MLYHLCCVLLLLFPGPSSLSIPVSAPPNPTCPLPQYDSTALMSAAGEGNEEIVRLLLERGANINAANDVSTAIV